MRVEPGGKREKMFIVKALRLKLKLLIKKEQKELDCKKNLNKVCPVWQGSSDVHSIIHKYDLRKH